MARQPRTPETLVERLRSVGTPLCNSASLALGCIQTSLREVEAESDRLATTLVTTISTLAAIKLMLADALVGRDVARADLDIEKAAHRGTLGAYDALLHRIDEMESAAVIGAVVDDHAEAGADEAEIA